MTDTRARVVGWLETFSQVESMKGNTDAIAKEIDTIVGVFIRENCWPDAIDATFQHLKFTSESRAWPTAAQVYSSLRAVQKKDAGEVAPGSQGGDRGKLTGMELSMLESNLDTCKRWMRMFPNLRSHARATLEYWGEPVMDDRGRKYDRAGM
ncbi:MAG: hypothetical protein U5N55_04825 [Cypionkella sp.]|nr:hypothetical protein [Cypionkella sp.]